MIGVFDRAEPALISRYRPAQGCLPRDISPSALWSDDQFHGSIPALYVPLSTLRPVAYSPARMTWGQSGALDLDGLGLAPYYILPVLTGPPCLDHILVLGELDLYRVILESVAYFSRARPHQGIEQQIPEGGTSSPEKRGKGEVIAFPVLNGLHHDGRWDA